MSPLQFFHKKQANRPSSTKETDLQGVFHACFLEGQTEPAQNSR